MENTSLKTNTEMVFKNGVISIQAAGYNGAYGSWFWLTFVDVCSQELMKIGSFMQYLIYVSAIGKFANRVCFIIK